MATAYGYGDFDPFRWRGYATNGRRVRRPRLVLIVVAVVMLMNIFSFISREANSQQDYGYGYGYGYGQTMPDYRGSYPPGYGTNDSGEDTPETDSESGESDGELSEDERADGIDEVSYDRKVNLKVIINICRDVADKIRSDDVLYIYALVPCPDLFPLSHVVEPHNIAETAYRMDQRR